MSLESYEENLKLYYESLRKDLDIILSSIIPMQKNHIKTILWINSSILGLTIALFKDYFSIALSIPFTFSFFGIFITLKGLKEGRIKAFGHPKAEDIENISQDEYEKTNGLIKMISAAKKAFEVNEESVNVRAKAISSSTNMTIMSVSSIFLIMIVHANLIFNKEHTSMSDEKKEAPANERPKMSAGSADPAKLISTSHHSEDLFAMSKRVMIEKSRQPKVESKEDPETKDK